MKQFKFFKGLKAEPLFWRTAMGEYKLVSDMSTEHIGNIISVIYDGQIPDPYLEKTNEEWRSIFENELRNRLYDRI